MKPVFLCDSHRMWFRDNPDEAIISRAKTYEASWRLCQHGRWQEALPYIGSAFETAVILLVDKDAADLNVMEWFLQTLSGLTRTLKQLGCIEACKKVYQSGIDSLQKEQQSCSDSAKKSQLESHISRLNYELGLLDCCQQLNVQRVRPLAGTQPHLVSH